MVLRDNYDASVQVARRISRFHNCQITVSLTGIKCTNSFIPNVPIDVLGQSPGDKEDLNKGV
jgi:hypothetical protein